MNRDGLQAIRKGTHTVRSSEVKRLRLRRGWDVAELSRRTGISEKTIQRIESENKPRFLSTITPIANALGVEPGELIVLDSLLTTIDKPITSKVLSITLRLECPIDDFDDIDKASCFMHELAKRLNLSGDIVVQDVGVGSVFIDILVSPEDAEKILISFYTGQLESLGVTSVKGNATMVVNSRDNIAESRQFVSDPLHSPMNVINEVQARVGGHVWKYYCDKLNGRMKSYIRPGIKLSELGQVIIRNLIEDVISEDYSQMAPTSFSKTERKILKKVIPAMFNSLTFLQADTAIWTMADGRPLKISKVFQMTQKEAEENMDAVRNAFTNALFGM